MTDDEPTWDIRTLANAYEDREPTEYIVDKFFATHSLNILYGAPGAMKSMLLADMCAHVVAGSDWLPGLESGGGGIPVKKAPVLWLDMDNGARRTDERFAAIGRAGNLEPDAPLFYISMPDPHLIAHDMDSMVLFRDTIWNCEARLVVIDNLGLITGDIEENSAMMAIVMGNLRKLAERTGAAFVVVHHQRKGGAQNSRPGDALRGHSSIEAAIDLALHIVKEKNSTQVTIRSTKTRGVDVPTVTARFNFDHISQTNDLRIAYFDGIATVHGENPVRDSIVDTLGDFDQITKSRLADEVHDRLRGEYGINKIRNWISEMVDVTGEIDEEVGARGAKILRRSNGVFSR